MRIISDPTTSVVDDNQISVTPSVTGPNDDSPERGMDFRVRLSRIPDINPFVHPAMAPAKIAGDLPRDRPPEYIGTVKRNDRALRQFHFLFPVPFHIRDDRSGR